MKRNALTGMLAIVALVGGILVTPSQGSPLPHCNESCVGGEGEESCNYDPNTNTVCIESSWFPCEEGEC